MFALAFGITLGASSGCGVLGNMTPPKGPASNVGTGCLNNANGLVQRYLKGQASVAEWNSSFDCVSQSLGFFTQYVHGSTPKGYTQNDMYTFMSKFIITNNAIQPGLILAGFQLKASLLGGNSLEFTASEINTFVSILPQLRDITASLIPYLGVLQNTNPVTNYQPYYDLAQAFAVAGTKLAALINTLPVGFLSEESVNQLITQLAASLNLPVIDGLSAKAFLGKWILYNTQANLILPQDWGNLIQTAMTVGGQLLIAASVPASDWTTDYRYREFLWQIAQNIRPTLDAAIASNNGVIPFPLIDHLIDQIPTDVLPAQASVIKDALRPAFRRLFASTTQIGLDEGVLNSIYAQGAAWIKNVGLLDRLYEQQNLNASGTSVSDLTNAMNRFASTLSPADQTAFASVQQTILSYAPQFYNNTSRIVYTSGLEYCHYQNFFVLTVQQLIEFLHQSYGSVQNQFAQSDFDSFYADFQNLLFGLKFVDITIPNWPDKRFQEADLFTPVSNGDGQVSYAEFVYYAMILTSSTAMAADMKTEIVAKCGQNLGFDTLGFPNIAADCFRAEFESRLDYWISGYFPQLKSFWDTLDAATQAQAFIWLEHGSRRNGYSQEPFAGFDFQALPTILHYTEGMFLRFDSQGGNSLNKKDIMNAFPVFKSVVAQKALGLSQKYVLDGIFTYIVHYRSMPVTTSLASVAKLVAWLAVYDLPTTKIDTDRTGIFNIVCWLADPETPSQGALTPTICTP